MNEPNNSTTGTFQLIKIKYNKINDYRYFIRNIINPVYFKFNKVLNNYGREREKQNKTGLDLLTLS